MKISKENIQPPRQQRGAVLLVGLVILLIMTVLGVSGLETTNLEMKMVNNTQNRQQAFQAAEAALKAVENSISKKGFATTQYQDCASGDATCFDDSCTGGLCFSGDYSLGETPIYCQLTPPNMPAWRDTALNVFETASRHQLAKLDNFKNDVKYITEFLCYVPKNPAVPFDASNPDNGIPFFRITTYGSSDDGKASVMLQSTYRLVQ